MRHPKLLSFVAVFVVVLLVFCIKELQKLAVLIFGQANECVTFYLSRSFPIILNPMAFFDRVSPFLD